jgi:hypothetical protein
VRQDLAVLRRRPLVWFAAAWLSSAPVVSAQTAPDQVDSIKQVFTKLSTCWRPPPPSQANPDVEITVIVSFRRDGTILGQPKITYESEQATDNDRLMYRIAVMQTLQRCTPMPFTAAMAGAVAGRPFAVKFHNRRPPPQPMEKRAWLLQKIL